MKIQMSKAGELKKGFLIGTAGSAIFGVVCGLKSGFEHIISNDVLTAGFLLDKIIAAETCAWAYAGGMLTVPLTGSAAIAAYTLAQTSNSKDNLSCKFNKISRRAAGMSIGGAATSAAALAGLIASQNLILNDKDFHKQNYVNEKSNSEFQRDARAGSKSEYGVFP